jgi:tetratricopeptide (TPR) repeat protein
VIDWLKLLHFMAMTPKALFAPLALALALGSAPAALAQTPDTPKAGRPTAPATSPEITQTRELIADRQWAAATKKIDQALAKRPRDPQWRFLQGVLLAETGKATEAISVFERLTEDFPELAEPYNNLAALYVDQNELQKARLLLERAITNKPEYALAHENLGDIYTWLAIAAYDKALKGTQPAPGVKLKLDYLQKTPALRQQRITTVR